MTNKQNLIPTQIVDKNGVVTTRHKKQENTAGKKAVIPAVAMPPSPQQTTTAEDHDKLAIQKFLTAVNAAGSPYFETAANLIHENDRTTIPLAMELLESGSDKARHEVKMMLRYALDELAGAYEYAEEDEKWRDNCNGSWSPRIKHQMMALWSLGNLVDDIHKDIRPLADDARQMDYMLHLLEGYRDRSGDAAYWRGLGIMTLNVFKVGSPENGKAFATWLGSQDDYEPLIAIVKERNILDIPTIIYILDEQEKTASALKLGTL